MTKGISPVSWGPFTGVGAGGFYNSWQPGGGPAGGTILYQDDFSSGNLDNWVAGAAVTYQANDVGMPHSVRCAYDGVAGTASRIFHSVSGAVAAANTSELYIEFDSKMNGSPNSKWVKLFGKEASPTGEANTTFSGNGGGNITMLAGNGGGTDNDAQVNYRIDGTYAGSPSPVPTFETVSPLGTVLRGDNVWQAVRLRAKMSAIGDGIYEIYVDGGLKYKATGVTNKNAANGDLDYLGFFDYSSGGGVTGDYSVANIKVLVDGWSS